MSFRVAVSSPSMRLPLLFAPAFVLLVGAPAAFAQVAPARQQDLPFAVGAGGFTVSDTGRAADVKSFSKGGFHVFGEVVLEPGLVLQLRYQRFTLPGQPIPFSPSTAAPDVRVDGGAASVGYLYRESWWDAGLCAGVGVYGLSPMTPGPGETSADVKETVVGWHAGVLTVFHVAAHVDLRVEAAATLLRTDASHKPITLGGSLAYHF
jgi:hypothetical protein